MPKYNGKESSGKGKSSQPTVEVITIPHVTSNVAPFLIDAIKAQKKLVSIQIKLSSKEQDYGDLQMKISCADVDEKDATGEIMGRMDASRQIEEKGSNPLFYQKTIVDQSMNDLLNKLQETDSSSIGKDEDILTSIAGGCFTFILELIEESKNKTSLRNAAICSMSSLVLNRRDCRVMFTKHIKRFVDAVGNAKTEDSMHSSNMHHARARESPVSEGIEMMRKNALRLLYDLSDNSHETEPSIVIAKRYLEEQKGINLRTGSYTRVRNNAEMIELRRIRDIAMKFSEKECSRIERIMLKIDACFDVLVPRFGHNSHILPSNLFSQISKQSGQESNECGHVITELIVEDDEGDSIAWEDGDEGVDDERANGMAQGGTKDHAEAVEQTLAVMKQSGAFHDGVMDISFGKGEGMQERCVSSSVSDVNTERTEKEAIDHLKKCVTSLMKRYGRIEVWVDAILSADNLTDSNRIISTQESRSTANPSSTEASSLIILPESIRSRKASTVTRLNEIKHRAAFAIANSRKIGIYKSNNSNMKSDSDPNRLVSLEHSSLLEPPQNSISEQKESLGSRGAFSSAAIYKSKKRKKDVRRGCVKIKVRR
eukprot:259975_1